MDGQEQPGNLAANNNPLPPDEAVYLRPAEQVSDQVSRPVSDQPQSPIKAQPPAPGNIVLIKMQPTQILPAASVITASVSPYATDDLQEDNRYLSPSLGFDSNAVALDAPANGAAELSWTSSEFVAHHKPTSWYITLGIVAILGALLVYVISKDFVAVAVILMSAGLFGYAASQTPRELEYTLSSRGIAVGPKFYPYSKFRSFSVSDDANFTSLDFMPLRRFDMPLTVYYDQQYENDILEQLTQHIPMDQHKHAMIDSLMHRIRF